VKGIYEADQVDTTLKLESVQVNETGKGPFQVVARDRIGIVAVDVQAANLQLL
jgi:hypothetical protein